MRRILWLILTLVVAASLVFATGCKKTIKNTPNEEDPTPGPGRPPTPIGQ